jgi:hypothetical protein
MAAELCDGRRWMRSGIKQRPAQRPLQDQDRCESGSWGQVDTCSIIEFTHTHIYINREQRSSCVLFFRHRRTPQKPVVEKFCPMMKRLADLSCLAVGCWMPSRCYHTIRRIYPSIGHTKIFLSRHSPPPPAPPFVLIPARLNSGKPSSSPSLGLAVS